MSDTPSLLRRTLAGLALPGGAALALSLGALLGSHALTQISDYSPATGVDGLVVLAVTALGAVVAAWLGLHLLLGALCVLGAATGRRWRAGERLVATHGPALVRRGVALAVGASLGLGGLAAASAAGPLGTTDAPDFGWVPTTGLEVAPVEDVTTDVPSSEDAPSDTSTPDATTPETTAPDAGDSPPAEPEPAEPDPVDPQPADLEVETVAYEEPADDSPADSKTESAEDADDDVPEPPTTRTVLVESGDSLWSLTKEILGDASDSDIATAWPELYEANRELVGADPHLIQPGQELVVPTVLEEQP